MSLSRRVVLSCLGALALTACTGDTASTPGDAHAAETILIGEYGSLTGSEATFGQSTHNGLMLAVEQINAGGGLNGKLLEVKTYDDQGKTQEAGTAVTRLVTDDKVVAIIGEVASSLSLAGGRVAQQYGVPMISPSSTNPTVTQVGDMIFRVCFVDSFQGFVVAKFAREDLKAQKVAVLYDQGQAYSTGLKDDFVREFTAAGGTLAGEPQAYTGGDIDFSAQLTTIRELQPDAIFLPGYYTDVANIALQGKKLGITAPLLGGDGWDSSELAKIAGESIEGAYYANHYSHEEQRPAVQNFVKSYEEKYKETPDGLAALGYDAGMLLFDAMKRAPSLGGKDLAAAIAGTKDFVGVTGTISIDAERNATKPAVIVQMRGGKPGYQSTVMPRGAAAPAPAQMAPLTPAPEMAPLTPAPEMAPLTPAPG